LRVKPIAALRKPAATETLATTIKEEYPVEEDFRIQPSVLADLGPLPEVVESNSDTVWHTFLQLEAQNAARSSRATSPSFWPHSGRNVDVSFDEVMAQARRFNRICPVEPVWLRLQAILADRGAPEAMQGSAFRKMSPLARRMALRDLVEWAAERGCLADVYAFLEALPEARWTHMGE
jgi:hypothetical protein